MSVFGNRIDGYRNSKRMAINGMMKQLCKEEDVGYVDLWDSFVGKEDMYARDGLHLSGKWVVPGTGQFPNSTWITTNQNSEGIRYSAILTERIRRQRRNTRTIG